MVGGEDHRNSSWTMGASKLCDSCKSATASLFCKPDSAFLCIPCDTKIHAANKLASRHARVWMCEVCEQAPAHVTCKADAASLCVACDRDIHSANPLARRHERFPVTPFYDSAVVPGGGVPAHSSHYLAQAENNNVGNGDGSEADEAEAASWLLPNLNFNASSKIIEANGKQGSLDQYDVYSEMDPEMDPYLDLEFGSMDQEKHQQNSSGADCVVPVQNKNIHDAFVNGGGQESCLDFDFLGPAKGYPYYNNGHCISRSVSSSEVGVVPEVSAMIDVSNPYGRQYNNLGNEPVNPPVQVSGVDREARVLRYREKRKNRKFEKTIRYASRKAYAETRPRIKGRFAKRTDIEVEVDQIYGSSPMLMAADSGYGIVPSF